MKLLLLSSGTLDAPLRTALVDLLGKPVEECRALVVPTALQPFPGGPEAIARLLRSDDPTSLVGLGWGSLGVLELSALPGVDRDAWLPGVRAADALLVWGGDPLHLAHWLAASGLAELLPSLPAVYVGVSAGSIATARVFGETYVEPPTGSGTPLSSEEVVLPDGALARTFVTATGAGLVDVGVVPHFRNPDHPDTSDANAEQWAARLPGPTYAIDDRCGLRVVDGAVDVVGDGSWRLFA